MAFQNCTASSVSPVSSFNNLTRLSPTTSSISPSFSLYSFIGIIDTDSAINFIEELTAGISKAFAFVIVSVPNSDCNTPLLSGITKSDRTSIFFFLLNNAIYFPFR